MEIEKKAFAREKCHSRNWNFPTDTPRQIHADSTSTLRWYVQDQISTNFHVVSTTFFDVISLIKKSTSSPRTLLDVTSMVGKFTLFSRTFFNVISMSEKSTLFSRTFIGVISLVKKIHIVSTYFFDVVHLVEISTLFLPWSVFPCFYLFFSTFL